MQVPRFFAPALRAPATAAALSTDEAHHLARVLRLGQGAEVAVFNGVGDEWRGIVTTVTRGGATVALRERITPAPEASIPVTLAVGVLKGDQMDHVVRDATMLGAYAIVPIASARVAVPARAWRSGAALDRWQRVALASARQCGRAVVPVVSPVSPLEDVLTADPARLTIIAVEPGHPQSAELDDQPRPAAALALVGPEGGWAPEEVERAIAAGARVIRLGPRTLRAETAPTVLLSALWTRWGW